MSINWNNIRPLDNSQNEGFEELVCQLARNENIPNKQRFIRKGKPDAGVECFWVLDNGDEWAWQAKFFTSSLEESQWKQIDKSVNTVLDKHPNLKRFYIAIPNDPPDARITGQNSMLKKWTKRVDKWTKNALEKGLTVEFLAWWSSDLISRLSLPKNEGLTYFWFNKEEFTDEWFLANTQQSILDLGKRYTPNFYEDLNVDVTISPVFDGISRNQKLKKQVQKPLDILLITGKKLLVNVPTSNSEKNRLEACLNSIEILFNEIEFGGVEQIPIEQFISLLDNIVSITNEVYDFYLTEEKRLKDSQPKIHSRYQKYGLGISTLNELQHILIEAKQAIQSDSIALANNPYLILEGEAGVGKSHLLADVITKRNESGACSLFLLGQHFVTEEDPWTQIKKKLDITCSFKEFLGALNSKAEATGQRLIVFIDAVNEGKGRYLWADNIRGFIQNFKSFPWIGLVISVRTSYSELLVSKDLLPNEIINRCTHYGFSGNEYEASKLFFNNFEIELPAIPLLHPEFQNPLFLLLFCEGLSKADCSRIPDGLQGISDIIGFFVSSVNQRLSKPNKFDFPTSINIVEKAINTIIAKKISTHAGFISYESAYSELNKLSQDFNLKRGLLLDSLISEGIFSKNLFWIGDKGEPQEGIYLAYERFEDHLTAKFLLDTHVDTEKEFQENGVFYDLFKNEHLCYQNKGLLEALSIQLPESKGKDFFVFAPYVRAAHPVVKSFVQSLLWRKIETVNEELTEYIDLEVCADYDMEELFWETVISVCSNPKHFFNASFLHQKLFEATLAERDGWWTVCLKDRYFESSAIKRLIDWAWNNCDKSYISSESKKLSSIAIAWLFTSTNRLLRDEATKALVCLLKENIDVLIELLKEFEGVNDPYVYERLFAVAYGCALTTKDKGKLKELSCYIFKMIFDTENEEIYPHILLRDYARGVIEFTYYIFGDFGLAIEKARPPYRSILPTKAPSNEELDAKYEVEFDEEKNYLYSQNSILSSMTTEYGRGTCGYGDFGRYTFQSALRIWKVNPDEMSNIAVDWIFAKYGYDAELHGRFDRSIGLERGRAFSNERIGKKYQWMVLHEILARVSDNCEMKLESGQDENEAYDGTWQPYVRDIDPSMPLRKTKKRDEDNQAEHWWLKEAHHNWVLSDKDWVNNVDDLPNASNLINVVDEKNNEWLVLEGYPEWAEPKLLGQEKWKQPHKRLWYQIRSYLLAEDDSQKLIDWATSTDFMGRWMPETSGSRYEVFDREYYWSPAFEYFNNYYYGGLEQREIFERGRHQNVCDVILTASEYSWENEVDKSIDGTFGILKPSKFIYSKMGLMPTDQVAEFSDKNNNIVCYSPSVYNDSKSYLLINKKAFIEFLQKHKLKIIWTVLGEKNIIGGDGFNDEYQGILKISGAFYLDESSNVNGSIKTKIISNAR